MKVEKILKAIKGLSDEEKQQVADALFGKEEQPVEAVEEVETVETEEAPTEEVEESPAEAIEEPTAEEADIQTEAEPEAIETEETEDGEMQVGEAEAEAPEEAPIETPEPIPKMPNSEPIEEAEEVQEQEQPLQDEEGGEMPVDYSQIIDGLNAKIMALEAENKQLKAKVEGAFGLTGKPAGFTAVNKLYGDTSDIPPMRK